MGARVLLSPWTSAWVPHQSGKGYASWACWEEIGKKICHPWPPFKAAKGPHSPWTSCGNHTVPQLEHPSNSRGTNSNLTLLLVRKLLSLLWKDRCAASNHRSSDVISSWSLTWHYCYFYSLSETRRGGCSGFHFSTTICQSDWTLDRTFIACVAFLTLSASPVPLAIPGNSACHFC